MVLELYREQEKIKAKKEYKENISKICDLDDICAIIEDLVERVNKVDFVAKENFVKEMQAWKILFISEMKFYEKENLNILKEKAIKEESNELSR